MITLTRKQNERIIEELVRERHTGVRFDPFEVAWIVWHGGEVVGVEEEEQVAKAKLRETRLSREEVSAQLAEWEEA